MRRFRYLDNLCAAAFAVLVGLPLGGQSIPKTWDEQALHTLEIPLATADASPIHISAKQYYSIPEMTVYKTYPRERAGMSEQEYFAWVREQEPEVIRLVPGESHSDAEWIRIGRSVFEWPSVIRPAESGGGQHLVIRSKGRIEFGALSCSSCHTRRFEDGTEIAGAQINMPQLWSRRRPATAAQLEGFRKSRLGDLSAPWLDPDPNAIPEDMPLALFARLQLRTPSPGPRFHTSLWSPAAMPSLIGVRDLKYLDRTGHARHRDIGDLMRYAALNFGGGEMSLTSSFGKYETGRPVSPNLQRLSDEHLYALARYVYSLEPPPNPNHFDETAARGKKVFEREGCAGCHPAPLYTNNKLTPAPGFRIPGAHRATYDILPASVGTDPWLAMKTRRGTGYYKIPSLRGVWYRTSFEHNGSVLTLEDWFDPARLEDDYVPTGWVGPKDTRAVKGHEFGLKLEPEDKTALIAFLKTL